MANVRKRHTAEFKAKVAVEAIRQQKTANELTAEFIGPVRKNRNGWLARQRWPITWTIRSAKPLLIGTR